MHGKEALFTSGSYNGTFDDVEEFSYIAWPAITFQDLNEILIYCLFGHTVLATELSHLEIDQSPYVFWALTKGRQGEPHGGYPKEQVASELMIVNHFVQVAICSGYQTEIAVLLGGVPHSPEGLFLQYAQKRFLQSKGHFADFIKKEGSAVGKFNKADAIILSPGKGPFAMTE
jgi:hypothetical protein